MLRTRLTLPLRASTSAYMVLKHKDIFFVLKTIKLNQLEAMPSRVPLTVRCLFKGERKEKGGGVGKAFIVWYLTTNATSGTFSKKNVKGLNQSNRNKYDFSKFLSLLYMGLAELTYLPAFHRQFSTCLLRLHGNYIGCCQHRLCGCII